MALLKSKLLFNITKRCLNISSSLSASHPPPWNQHWRPGPYPKTEEERLAAAKKYGLLPEEYQPIPDDGQGAGDYPAFKPYSVESRDPFYPWDYPEYRRNHGEAIEEDFNMYTEDRIDINKKYRYSGTLMIGTFLGVMTGSYLLMLLFDETCFFPMKPLHMPAPGVKHYKYSTSPYDSGH